MLASIHYIIETSATFVVGVFVNSCPYTDTDQTLEYRCSLTHVAAQVSTLKEPVKLGMQRSSSAGMVGTMDSKGTDRETDVSNQLRRREKEREREAEQKRELERQQQQLRKKEQEDRLREKEREEERLRRRGDDSRSKDGYRDHHRAEKESGFTFFFH